MVDTFSRTHSDIFRTSWDVIVVGAGAAGLMTCLELPSNLKVLLLNRNTSRRSSSRWAQGGIAAAIREEDSFESHAEDTINAGAGLCDKDAVEMLVKEAPNCVQRLERFGMQFDRDSDQLATTLEAAHSFRRVLHVQDQTGRALVDVLQDQVEQRANILHRRGVRVSQLWLDQNRCQGVQVLDGQCLYWIPARAVVLATGGGGHLFANTTNPPQSCGEGVALAWKARAVIEDLEFVQFHPTALQLEGAPCFLISEALRGEGAVLVDNNRQSPVSHLSGGDLAARDQVSRALVTAMKAQQSRNIGLDATRLKPNLMEIRFPTIFQRCREFGLDPTQQPIPVAPAAHYWMGGVATDLNAATTVPGLYAVGEVACSGLHGANRLASNSLMECLVFARQMKSIELGPIIKRFSPHKDSTAVPCSVNLTWPETSNSLMDSIEKLRQTCWREAGVDRSPKGIQHAILWIRKHSQGLTQQPLLQYVNKQCSDQFYRFDDISRKNLNLLLDLSHRQITSSLLLEACLFRSESRGGHFRSDAPLSMPYWQCHTRQRLGLALSTRAVKN